MSSGGRRALSRLAALVAERGKCAGTVTPGLWFPSDPAPTEQAQARAAERARAACAGCPVTAQCLALALGLGEEHGIWGGTAAHERVAMLSAPRTANEQLVLWPADDASGDAA